MNTDSVDPLDNFAAKVDEEFVSHRQFDEFKTISFVIDTSQTDWTTLIVHVDGKEAGSLAEEVEPFLAEYNAQA